MTNIQQTIDDVRQWGRDKQITGPDGKATLLTQLSKTQEELDETMLAAEWVARGVVTMKNKKGETVSTIAEVEDGIGDQAVTLVLAAELAGLRFEDCLAAAYDEIKGRTGRMVNGTFCKD